ncbi:integrase [Peribacillus saganii]|uniref:Integrase n=1 Tax=Peribacillus saganii TaxID=2303992 RepID=A0A372LSJ6_9BACI|nr:tyrosine-type recombinase/integrase [Peribacillus saganii]RFU71016.1 integrase [Peribacillus saganii]
MILKLAIKAFHEDNEFKNLSAYTIKNYKLLLSSFESYCINVHGITEVKDISRDIIKQFLWYCKSDLGNNHTTLNNKIRVLKVFFNYLVAEDKYEFDKNLFKNIKFAKVEDRVDTFTDKHLKQILRYFDRQSRNKPYHAYRNKMIVITMLSAGIRAGETVNLRWADVDFDNSMISVYGKKRKVASIPIAAKLRKELAEFYVYTRSFFDGQPGPYVFCASDKKQLTPDAIGSLFKRLKKLFNFDDVRLSAHTFRHSFASRALKNGMDSITLQRILRHESLQMTQRYVNMWGTALKEPNEKFNPLNDIDI